MDRAPRGVDDMGESGKPSTYLNEPAEIEWRLKVNATYQEVMKTLMNLVSASLVLPFFFIRNFVAAKPGEIVAKPLLNWAYYSWSCFFVSLGCCLAFFWISAKYVKELCEPSE